MELLSVDGLSLFRHRGVALRRGAGGQDALVESLSFSIEAGQGLALVGDSRDAMQAIALAVAGEWPVSIGTIRFDTGQGNTSGRGSARESRRGLQAIFPDSLGQLRNTATVRMMFTEVLDLWHRGKSREERESILEEVMSLCGLPEAIRDLYPPELNRGERQRVALARSLLPRPKLLVCCGPTDGLDAVQRAEFLQRLARVSEVFSLALLILTDDLAAAAILSDILGVIHCGQLVEMGTAAEVISNPVHTHTQRLVASCS